MELTEIKKKMNKRGVVGLETSKGVLVALMVLGVFGFVVIIALNSLSDSEAARSSGERTILGETLTAVSEGGQNFSAFTEANAACSIITLTNTTGVTIPSDNFTQSNCNVAFSSINGTQFNNTDWIVNYTYSYNQFATINNNLSNGTETFFGNATTWFSLLAVVVIILIVSIVIFAVNRFGDSAGGTNF